MLDTLDMLLILDCFLYSRIRIRELISPGRSELSSWDPIFEQNVDFSESPIFGLR